MIIQRTSLINHARGLLAEYGIVLPQGAWRFVSQAPAAVESADLSDLGRELFLELLDQLTDVNDRIAKIDRKISEICRDREDCRRLSNCQASVRSLQRHSLLALRTDVTLNPGELAAWIGLVRDNTRLAANHALAELAAERTIIYVAR